MVVEKLLLGNHALAQGALESGVGVATSYPGTPASEVLGYLISQKHDGLHVEWSVNEKVALEVAVGASYCGVRSICVMKHVGLNVALDALMTLAYTGVKAGLVLVVCDDPGMYSSQNGQDSRRLIEAAKLLCFEPKDAQQAKEMVVEAFEISEKLGLPVIVRTVTQVAHCSSVVSLGKIVKPGTGEFKKDIPHYVMVPQYAKKRRVLLFQKQGEIREYVEESRFNELTLTNDSKGFVASGPGVGYAKEFSPDSSILSCGTFPIPQGKLDELSNFVEKIYVIEDGEAVIEEKVTSKGNVFGKLSKHLPEYGELIPDDVSAMLTGVKNKKESPVDDIPPRPPVLCPGCPHRGTYYVMNKLGCSPAIGDIGCYSLGVQKPFEVMDTLLCMGAAVGKASGVNHSGVEPVYSLIGDSTFLHGGIPGLLNAVYNGANIILVIFDNHDVSMTGHQPTPLTGRRADGTLGNPINLNELCKSCGASFVKTYNPLDLKETENVFNQANEQSGVRVLIADSPCALISDTTKQPYTINPGDCTSCGMCINLGCPAIVQEKNNIKIIESLCTGCDLCRQICPASCITQNGI